MLNVKQPMFVPFNDLANHGYVRYHILIPVCNLVVHEVRNQLMNKLHKMISYSNENC